MSLLSQPTNRYHLNNNDLAPESIKAGVKCPPLNSCYGLILLLDSHALFFVPHLTWTKRRQSLMKNCLQMEFYFTNHNAFARQGRLSWLCWKKSTECSTKFHFNPKTPSFGLCDLEQTSLPFDEEALARIQSDEVPQPLVSLQLLVLLYLFVQTRNEPKNSLHRPTETNNNNGDEKVATLHSKHVPINRQVVARKSSTCLPARLILSSWGGHFPSRFLPLRQSCFRASSWVAWYYSWCAWHHLSCLWFSI